jgi:hypothetical protein
MSPLSYAIAHRSRRLIVGQVFDDLFWYSQTVEVSLLEKSAERVAMAITSEVFYPGKLEEYEIERLQDEQRQLRESFPQALRIATLGLTQSALEAQLLAIAELAGDSRSTKFDTTSLGRRPPIWAAKTFLDQCGIETTGTDWDLLQHYQNVRNSFVHFNGNVDCKLHSGGDVRQSARQIRAQIVDQRIELTREASAEFPVLCRRLCMQLLQSLEYPTRRSL